MTQICEIFSTLLHALHMIYRIAWQAQPQQNPELQ